MTMTLISTYTVGSGGIGNIEFAGIPQTGTDLYMVCSLRSTGAAVGDDLYVFINGSVTQTGKLLLGSASTASSSSPTIVSGRIVGNNATTNTFGNVSIYVSNYTSSANKLFSVDCVTENNATTADKLIAHKLRADTNPITSLMLGTNLGSFAEYSTASLYMITKGSGGATVS